MSDSSNFMCSVIVVVFVNLLGLREFSQSSIMVAPKATQSTDHQNDAPAIDFIPPVIIFTPEDPPPPSRIDNSVLLTSLAIILAIN